MDHLTHGKVSSPFMCIHAGMMNVGMFITTRRSIGNSTLCDETLVEIIFSYAHPTQSPFTPHVWVACDALFQTDLPEEQVLSNPIVACRGIGD